MMLQRRLNITVTPKLQTVLASEITVLLYEWIITYYIKCSTRHFLMLTDG